MKDRFFNNAITTVLGLALCAIGIAVAFWQKDIDLYSAVMMVFGAWIVTQKDPKWLIELVTKLKG